MVENACGKASSANEPSDNQSTECPTCGREDFKSVGGMRIHHHAKHGEKLSQVLECEQCGCEYERPPSQSKNSRFCSYDCKYERMETEHSGSNNPNYNGGSVTVSCEYCDSDYTTDPHNVENTRFCSRDCLSSYRSENIVGEKAPGWNGGLVKTECGCCGERIERKPNEVQKYENVFCSQKCRASVHAERFSGEDHPNWNPNSVGGGFYSTTKWKETRNAILNRDNYQCQSCGASDAKLHIHHIVPRSAGGKDHGHSNLVTFCMSCHNKWEGLYLRPDTRHTDD